MDGVSARMPARMLAGALVALLVLSFGVVLPSFGAAEAATTTITFWHTYNTQSAEEKTMLEEVIPAFERQNPGIKVEAQGIPYQEFRQKLLTAFAGGVVPDVVRMDIIWVPEFADMGALLPVDNLPGFQELKEAVFPGPLSTVYWKGRYYGLPLDTNTQVLLYNQALWNQAGAAAPKSFSEFVAVARKLTQRDASGKPTRYGYALPGPWAWYFLPWLWSNGGSVTDPQITRATGYLNSPQSVQALQMLVDLYKEGTLAPTIAQAGLDSWAGFGQNVYAATQDGPWAFPSLLAQYPDLQIGSALFPAGSGAGAQSASVVGGEDVVIFADSKNREAAWKFVRYLLSPEAQMAMATTGQIPVLASALTDPYIVHHDYYGIYLQQLQTANARTPHPAWSRMEESMQLGFQAAVAGQMTVKQAMDQAAAEIDGMLK